MKRAVRKIKRIVCCLLIGLLLSEQIAAAVHAEGNGQQNVEEDAGNGTVSGNDAVPDRVYDAENTANEESAAVPYAEESRANDTFTEGNLRYRISDADAHKVVCIEKYGRYDSTLTIPGTVDHDGVTYSVWRIEDKALTYLYTDSPGSVIIEEGIEEIGNNAFEQSHELRSVTLPQSLKSIGYGAFESCGLEELDLQNVCQIGGRAFCGCGKLGGTLEVPEGIAIISDEAFNGCAFTEVRLPSTLIKIGKIAFGSCDFESIMIPSNVTEIGLGAFLSCGNLKNINIPDGITKIEGSLFQGCSQLETIDLPESIKRIDFSAFNGCSSLKRVEIPKSVTSIISNAFVDCSSLEEVKLWDTVTISDMDTFKNCQNLSVLKIIVTGNTPLKIDSKAVDTFAGCPVDRRLVFLNEDGTELTGDALAAAQNAYRAVNDGSTTDDRWYGWKIGDTPAATYVVEITASASEGGRISPDGKVKVDEGTNQTFTITPQEGYEIQEVLVDGKSQGAIAAYTFTNVTENHTISVSFLKKEETGGTEKPGEGEGGTEKPGENEGGTGGTEKPGENEGGTGGTDRPGENAGGTGKAEKPGENAGETEGTDRSGESESNNGGSGNRGNVGSEPKTGDFSSVEIYATAAMIAGLLYLLLSFAEMKGLTETKKKEIISSIISWANEGRKYRKYVALAAIFFVLVYYHSIGKSTMAEAKCVF